MPHKAVIFADGCVVAQGGRTIVSPQGGTPSDGEPTSTGESAAAGGQAEAVKLPYVVLELCIGCGICQYNCPVPDQAAMVVRAVQQSEALST